VTAESNKKDHQSLTIKLQTVEPRAKQSGSAWDKVKRALRLVLRVIKLMIAMSPIVALYPLHCLLTMVYLLPENTDDETKYDAHQVTLASLQTQLEMPSGPVGWYHQLCLHCVEWNGAAAIKMMQWAGSRPDMFGQSFCAVFSQLYDDTTPHSWKHTDRALRKAYGDNWQEHLRLDGILRSGCIAQVYKGAIFDEDNNEQPVAVKVMHPNVDRGIDADLDIMRLSTHILERVPFDVFRNMKWLNLPGFVEEMSTMLSIQLDLRQEADHLERKFQRKRQNRFSKGACGVISLSIVQLVTVAQLYIRISLQLSSARKGLRTDQRGACGNVL
jgi:predicted unusual protein kinase regulating ubiquinone biosynthesis (AarF/ABC1/UbiB family)